MFGTLRHASKMLEDFRPEAMAGSLKQTLAKANKLPLCKTPAN